MGNRTESGAETVAERGNTRERGLTPRLVASATAAGTRQAFMLLAVFALAEAVCVALVFGVHGGRSARGRSGVRDRAATC